MWTLLLLYMLGTGRAPVLVYGIPTEAECQAMAYAAMTRPGTLVDEAICHEDKPTPKGEPS